MVATHDLLMYGSRLHLVDKSLADDEVVYAPPYVFSACPHSVTPPAVLVLGIGVKMAESVDEAAVEQDRHLFTFLIGKSSIEVVGLRILEVYLLMSDIEVATVDYRLERVQSYEICTQGIFPLHTVGQPTWQLSFLLSVLAVGSIAAYEVETVHLKGDEASLPVMLLLTEPIGHRQGFVSCENGRATVALFLRVTPILMITWQVEADLTFLQFGLLKTKEICIHAVEYFHEVLAHDGAESIYIPANEFQFFKVIRLSGF